MVLELLKMLLCKKHECKHTHVTPDMDIAYCPDCGQLIKNEWYITRCACCGIKEKAIIKNGEIIPAENYCRNCGADSFVVEKLDKINFIDINYAVLVKTVIENHPQSFTQSWEEPQTSANKPQLLPQFL